jgi:hypothetical protein
MSSLHTYDIVNKQRPFLRQYYLFYQALCEVYEDVNESNIVVNHSNGSCFYKDVKYGLIYPTDWLNRINVLLKENEKSVDFFFSGYKSHDMPHLRDWVLEFENLNSYILYSNRGRVIPRDLFDIEFFLPMVKSKFTLCPQGYPYKWTYRFFEAALCKSIPILKSDDICEEYNGFKYYVHSDSFDYEYSLDIVEHNYNIAVKHLFIN